MALANLIRRYRVHHGGMTQQEVAKLIGVSRQTVNAIERSKYSPTLEIAFRISRVFGASLEEIFSYEPNIEGEHPFGDGVEVAISWDRDDSGDADNDGN